MLGVMRNLAEITRSRDLPPRRLAGTYAALHARRALGRHPQRLRVLDRTLTYADYAATLTLFEEIFLRRAYPFRPRVPHPLVVDCGANIGMATLFFKSLAPDARVLAFEPEPEAFALLEENVRGNRLDDVECFGVALGSEAGVGQLRSPAPASGGASLVFGGEGWSSTDVVVERLTDRIGDNRVDFLKIDVEGSEGAILDDLAGAGALARVAELALEFHPTAGRELGELLQLLREGGFELRISVVGDRIWEPDQLLLVHAFRVRPD